MTTAPVPPLLFTIFPANVVAPEIVNVSVPTPPKESVPVPEPKVGTRMLLPLVANVVPVIMFREDGVRVNIPVPAFVIVAVPAPEVTKAPVKVNEVPDEETFTNVAIDSPTKVIALLIGIAYPVVGLVEFSKVPPEKTIPPVPRLLTELDDGLRARVPAVKVNPPENEFAPENVTVNEGALIITAPVPPLPSSTILPEKVPVPIIVKISVPVPLVAPKDSVPAPTPKVVTCISLPLVANIVLVMMFKKDGLRVKAPLPVDLIVATTLPDPDVLIDPVIVRGAELPTLNDVVVPPTKVQGFVRVIGLLVIRVPPFPVIDPVVNPKLV